MHNMKLLFFLFTIYYSVVPPIVHSYYIIFTDTVKHWVMVIGYEPAGLTVHSPPPKKKDRGWVHFFRMGV